MIKVLRFWPWYRFYRREGKTRREAYREVQTL